MLHARGAGETVFVFRARRYEDFLYGHADAIKSLLMLTDAPRQN